MELTHFLSLIPLFFFFTLALIFWRTGLLHLVTVGYIMALSFFALYNQWEMVFIPILLGVFIISITLFIIAMAKGDLL